MIIKGVLLIKMEFVLNINNEIIDEIRKLLDQNDSVSLSISYISLYGWNILTKGINLKNKKIKIITTTDDNITDYNILKYFLDNDIEVSLINKNNNSLNRSLHTKF